MAKKKEAELMSESDAYKHIVDLFGDNTVYNPSEIEAVETFTTRSPNLDRALGVGGWARGRIYQLAGRPSSGKTFMSLIAMAEWQSKDPENCCCFIDAEFTYDPVWAAKLGIDNDRVLLIKTNDAEKIFTGLVGRFKKNQKTGVVSHIPGILDMIKDGQYMMHKVNSKQIRLNLGKMGVMVLDSIAAMGAPSELESDVGKVQMSPLARFLTTELRKLTPAVAQANVCFIAINHVKDKINTMGFGNPETTPGGAAFKHACSVMLMVAPMFSSDNQILDSREEKIGHKIKIKVEKNKMATPFKTAEFFISFNEGVTRVEEQLLELALMYGVIKKLNNISYDINGQKVSSKDSALEYVKTNRASIEESVRNMYLSGDIVTLENEHDAEFPDTQNPFDSIEEE